MKFFLALLVGMVMVGSAQAANSRGAKASFALNYTTTVSSASTGAAVLYGVMLSTATTAGDYIVIYDSGSVVGLTAGGPYTLLKAKLVLSTTGQAPNQVVVFDPPLQFNNGIVAVNSAATTTATLIYERGRIPQGY